MKDSTNLNSICSNRILRAVAIATLAAAPCATAGAQVSSEADAHVLDVNVDAVFGLLNLHVGPVIPVSGQAPAAFNNSQTLLNINASAPGIATLSTGLLNAQAESDVTSLSISGFSQASATIDDLSLRIVPGAIFLIPDLISVSALTISSTSRVEWDGDSFTTSGGVSIEDFSISIAGVGQLAIVANPAPNTVLFDALGIRIVLNEQIMTSDIDSMRMSVNAIHISVDPLLNVVDADVVIAHSEAAMLVPAPTSALLGAGVISPLLRRRRRKC